MLSGPRTCPVVLPAEEDSSRTISLKAKGPRDSWRRVLAGQHLRRPTCGRCIRKIRWRRRREAVAMYRVA